jgi:hypothetical protein
MADQPQASLEQSHQALDVVEGNLKFLTQKPLEETLAAMTDFERAKFKTVLRSSQKLIGTSISRPSECQ